MIVFPNCKINIGLYITERRADNYHNLETIFYPVPFSDALEIITTPAPGTHEINITSSGLALDISPEKNICYTAYNLISRNLHDLPNVKIHLHKNIPSGAGLGGGSSDGAFTLRLLNDLLHAGLNEAELAALALQLGSDCPFFLKNTACYAEGRGEQLSEVGLDLTGYYLALVNPGIHINTGQLFSKIRPKTPSYNSRKILQLPVNQWKEIIENDFETPVFEMYPQIENIKKHLYDSGALYASLTGTGSTVYGLFEREPTISFPGYFTKILQL